MFFFWFCLTNNCNTVYCSRLRFATWRTRSVTVEAITVTLVLVAMPPAALADPLDRALQYREEGTCRKPVAEMGLFSCNRGFLGISPHHAHEVAHSCLVRATDPTQALLERSVGCVWEFDVVATLLSDDDATIEATPRDVYGDDRTTASFTYHAASNVTVKACSLKDRIAAHLIYKNLASGQNNITLFQDGQEVNGNKAIFAKRSIQPKQRANTCEEVHKKAHKKF